MSFDFLCAYPIGMKYYSKYSKYICSIMWSMDYAYDM